MSVKLETLSLTNLASLYNLLSDKQVTKFKDKATGVARLTDKLAATEHEVFEVDGEYDVRPVQVEQKEDSPVATLVEKKVGGQRGRKSDLLGKNLSVVRDANPKREGSRTRVRYEVYKECKTSDDFMRICEERNLGTRREILSDLAYDSEQQFIRLS